MGMVPVNLINEIKQVGFDYGMSPRDVAEGVLAGHVTLWEREVNLSSPSSEDINPVSASSKKEQE